MRGVGPRKPLPAVAAARQPTPTDVCANCLGSFATGWSAGPPTFWVPRPSGDICWKCMMGEKEAKT